MSQRLIFTYLIFPPRVSKLMRQQDTTLPVIQELPSTPIIRYNPTEPSNALLVAGTGSTWRDTSTLVIGDISDDAHNSLTVVSPKSPTPSQNTASK